VCLWTAGCGYVGDPLPPLANIPAAVTELAAVQRGGRIIVHFTAPMRTTEGILIHSSLDYDLRAGTASVQPFEPDAWAAQAQRIQGIVVEQGLATAQFPSAPFAGKDVTIAVRSTGASGKTSKWSNFVNLSVVAAPPQPTGLRAESVAQGVRLTWDGPEGDFRVFRRGPDEAAFASVGDTHSLSFTDANTTFGKPYTYIVQRIVKAASGPEAQSDLSPEVSISPVDTFPPAAPSGLRATAAPASIELSWDANAEPDLGGYRVYRSVAGGPFERVAELQAVPSYSDRAIESGKSYRYAISAFDQAGNESPRTAPAEATAQ
jgi:fibronectin type 3 domain-containing protein